MDPILDSGADLDQVQSVAEELTIDGSRLRSVLTLEVGAVTIAPADYPRFARFCQAVDELSARPPTLERAGP